MPNRVVSLSPLATAVVTAVAGVLTQIEEEVTTDLHLLPLGVAEVAEGATKVVGAPTTIIVQRVVAATAVVPARAATSRPGLEVVVGRMRAIVDGEPIN
jgi:hypothetical protein